ncbi:MAG: NmrA family NAD(P)-binding protein [Chitinophagaceae bacterium]|nr:NmrA family NAD(P)-binding protein [Chitinophagaceae bacterium]
MKEKILITSATGKTGYPATVQLLKDGYQVKILVRSRNSRALALEKLGAEIQIGQLSDLNDLIKALADVKRVYYCHPFVPGLLINTKTFIEAAKLYKLDAVVMMGQWLAEFTDQNSIHTNETREAYRLFKEANIKVVYLIPGFFADNLFFVLEFATQLGLMPLPFSHGRNPAVSNEDLGLVIASLLKNPSPYIGQKLRPSGPVSLSAKEMAAIFSKTIGRKVRYMNIPEWMFLKAAFVFAKDLGLDAFTISQVRHYMHQYRLNKFDIGGPTQVVKQLTGKEPDDFETIVKRYLNNSPYMGRSFAKWVTAIKKFLQIPFAQVPNIAELEALNK